MFKKLRTWYQNRRRKTAILDNVADCYFSDINNVMLRAQKAEIIARRAESTIRELVGDRRAKPAARDLTKLIRHNAGGY